MKEVVKLLKKLGLSTTETKLYLYGLQFAQVNVAVLVKLSDVKRTTAYHALSTLVEKGLAAQSRQVGKLYYRMTPASELSMLLESRKDQLESQVKEIQRLMPQFPKVGQPQVLPEVVNYHGIEGVQSAVERALRCEDQFWRIISPKNNFFRNSSREYINYFKRMRADRGIKAKSLWESSVNESKSIIKEDIALREPRIIPASMDGKFKSSIITFDDKVLIISSHKQRFATLITSHETSDTFKLMFDAIWDISEPVKVV